MIYTCRPEALAQAMFELSLAMLRITLHHYECRALIEADRKAAGE